MSLLSVQNHKSIQYSCSSYRVENEKSFPRFSNEFKLIIVQPIIVQSNQVDDLTASSKKLARIN